MAFTFNHKSFLFFSFMPNRKYSYIFSAIISSGNISSQSLTGLYNLRVHFCVTSTCPRAQIMLGFTSLMLELSLNSEERTQILFCFGKENVCAIIGGLVLCAIQIFSLESDF